MSDLINESREKSGWDIDTVVCFGTSLLTHLLLLLAALVTPENAFDIDKPHTSVRTQDSRTVRTVPPVLSRMVQPSPDASVFGDGTGMHHAKDGPEPRKASARAEEVVQDVIDLLPGEWRVDPQKSAERLKAPIRQARFDSESARKEGRSKVKMFCYGCPDCWSEPDHPACTGGGVSPSARPVLLTPKSEAARALVRQNRLPVNLCLRRHLIAGESSDLHLTFVVAPNGRVVPRRAAMSDLERCVADAMAAGTLPPDQRSSGILAISLDVRPANPLQ